MKPLVTVLMPVYNGERFLVEALNSILGQTFRDFEFVIVDDGSTDETATLLGQVRDPRVRVLTQANGGMSAALNAGLATAVGIYVARMDQDDVARSERLATQVSFLQGNPKIAAVGSSFRTIDERGRCQGSAIVLVGNAELRRDLFVRCPFGHGTVMARRDVMLDLGGYDGSKWPAEDYDIWRRLMTSRDVANVPALLYDYRVYADDRYTELDARAVASVQEEVWSTGTVPALTLVEAARDLRRYRELTASSSLDLLDAYVVQHWKLLRLLILRGRYLEAMGLWPALLLGPWLAPRVFQRLRPIARKMASKRLR